MNRELAKIDMWCKQWEMLMNINKTEVVSVSRSMSIFPPALSAS